MNDRDRNVLSDFLRVRFDGLTSRASEATDAVAQTFDLLDTRPALLDTFWRKWDELDVAYNLLVQCTAPRLPGWGWLSPEFDTRGALKCVAGRSVFGGVAGAGEFEILLNLLVAVYDLYPGTESHVPAPSDDVYLTIRRKRQATKLPSKAELPELAAHVALQAARACEFMLNRLRESHSGTLQPNGQSGPSHSDDFRSVTWNGTKY